MDRRTTAVYGGFKEFGLPALPLSVTTMPDAYWEMERRRLLGNRTSAIEGYAALEYPRESVAAVLKMIDRPTPRNGWRLRRPVARLAPYRIGPTSPAPNDP